MPKTDTLHGSLDLLVLKILAQRPGLHGYAVVTAILEFSQGVLWVQDGSLYPALARMEKAGWVRGKSIAGEMGKPLRIYGVTAAGKRQLAGAEERWAEVTKAVGRVLKLA